MGGHARPNERRAVAKANRVSETLKMQCGEGGVGRKKRSGPLRIAADWKATALEAGVGGGGGLRRSRRVGGGL